MKSNRTHHQVFQLLVGILQAVLPWGFPLFFQWDRFMILLAGIGSLVGIVSVVLTVLEICFLKQQKKQYNAELKQLYEELAQIAPPPQSTPNPQTPEEWMLVLRQTEEAVRAKKLSEERANRGFVVQWTQKLQKLRAGIEDHAEQLLKKNPIAIGLERDSVALGCLTEQLLQYFECSDGNLVCNRKLTDLSQVISDAIVRNAAMLQSKKIGLRRMVSHLYSVTDATVLAMVLDQLLDNAVRHTEENGIIGISCRDAGDTVRLSVEDAGCGIPPEELPRIFERGFVGSYEQPGCPGMGLFTARSYLELLGHGLEVRSAPGKGTQVIIVLKKEAAAVAEKTE